MTSLIYLYDTKYTETEYPYISKVKVKGDQWCRKHCADLHASEFRYNDHTNVREVIFKFRTQSDLTAFKIGFCPNDI